jgi:ABC-type branched-subunit amino acid transport system substrate-binding protein/glycosylphosphatidylinositol transamidase (GPIT) subunit GPI8
MVRGAVFGCAVCLACVVCLAGLTTSCASTAAGPIRIGVMLPLTGPDAVGFKTPLSWAQANVNAAGGIDGQQIQFVYRDLGRHSALSVAKSFASDPSLTAVIGPANSEDAMQVTSLFVDHHKVIVSPSATSADLFRAFANDHPQYFWRPLESDIGQVQTMLVLAAQGGAKSVAMVAGTGAYGTTFFDWFGFLATQMGLRVTATIRYDQESQPCRSYVDQALDSRPDVLLAVPDHATQAICMARQYRSSGSPTRLLFSDAAQDPSLIQSLGAQAQGLEGTGLAPDPADGFSQAFEARFHELPTPYAANAYDSVLLLAYGLEDSGGQGGAQLAQGISAVVSGHGHVEGWNASAVRRTLSAIRAGRHPAIDGAVGPWDFDKSSGIELVAATYEHWRIEGNQFDTVQYLSTAGSQTAEAGLSAQKQRASPDRADISVGGTYQPGPKVGDWALLVAASDGWDNYRHQADVLAQYQLLRANGIPADHIIVVSANDIAYNRHNPEPGTVRYSVGGPNLYRDVHVDYPLRGMTAGRLMDILSGHRSADTPKVIHSGPGDDVYVFIAGHGNQNGVYLGLGESVPSPNSAYSVITPDLLDQTVATMAADHDYRQMLITVEACEGGVLGENLDAPGALLISAASPVENSLSANYDPASLTWLADQFAYQLWRSETKTPNLSLDALYEHLYLNVDGSHVSAYGSDFGDAEHVRIREFLTP